MSECVNFSIWFNFKLDCTRSMRRFSSSPATAFHVGRWCGRGASGASRLLRNAGISLPKQHARRMERNCTVGPVLAQWLGHWHKFHYSTQLGQVWGRCWRRWLSLDQTFRRNFIASRPVWAEESFTEWNGPSWPSGWHHCQRHRFHR